MAVLATAVAEGLDIEALFGNRQAEGLALPNLH